MAASESIAKLLLLLQLVHCFIQFHRYTLRATRRKLDAPVAGVAGGDHLPIPQHLVLEAEGGTAHVREFRAERELVVEADGFLVEEASLDDHEAEALILHLPVRESGGAEPLDATDLEVG